MSFDPSLTQLTLAQAATRLAQHALSPVELTRAHLARIEQVDPHLTSFLTVTAEQALAQARAAETEIARGNYRGPLHGVPLALKDVIETAGTRTTAGSQQLREYVPTEDATVVRRLKQAGAILLGKLAMHEWAMDVTNINPFYGTCRNPWDTERIPGGSSGGSGAALAAELCLGALGSDTAGSIRIPAALCGVVGLKPTFGRVSTRGVLPLSWSLDHVGPMARRVRDVALLLQVLAGYDPADPHAANVPVPDFSAELDEGVRGWRVALVTRQLRGGWTRGGCRGAGGGARRRAAIGGAGGTGGGGDAARGQRAVAPHRPPADERRPRRPPRAAGRGAGRLQPGDPTQPPARRAHHGRGGGAGKAAAGSATPPS